MFEEPNEEAFDWAYSNGFYDGRNGSYLRRYSSHEGLQITYEAAYLEGAEERQIDIAMEGDL